MTKIQKKENKGGSTSCLIQIKRKGFKAYNKTTRNKAAVSQAVIPLPTQKLCFTYHRIRSCL